MNEWLSVTEVSKKTNIPEATVRRYIREHAFHLRVKKGHKSYQIFHESIEVFNQIREMYGNGKNMDEVNDALAENKPMIITVDERDGQVAVNVAQALIDLKQGMDEKMKDLSGEIVRLRQELAMTQDKLEDYEAIKTELDVMREQASINNETLENHLKNVHEKMDEMITESRKERQTRENKKWWKIW